MCGIAGFIGEGTREDLGSMCAALSHRGPDATDIWLDDTLHVGLAHARLSVLDHAGGVQPMWTDDGQVGIVFNGEIYNFAELRRELTDQGCKLRTDHSDTEAVLYGYRVWGEQVISRLNGMWAFVIIDRSQRRLFASRDRFGKKPLYYQHQGANLLFASEITALERHPGVERAPDTLAIKKYFAYGYIPAPFTQYQAIRKLPPGHNLVFDFGTGQWRIDRYWRFTLAPRKTISVREASERLLTLLDAAVARRLVADVPVGMFLSGGIDSSLVSALASHHLPRGRFKTFSIGFDEDSFDETAYARAMGARIGSDHVERRLRVDDVVPLIDTIAGRLDEPLADASLLPTFLVSRVAREQVTVALGGDGADELFAGYGPFQALRWGQLLHAICPSAGLQALRWCADRLQVSHGYMSLDFKIKRALGGLEKRREFWVPAWMAPLDVAEANLLVADGTFHAPEEIYSEVLESWAACTGDDLASKTLQFFTELYLSDDILTKVDRASMMNSLEVRAPFLDVELVDFVRTLPVAMKLRGGQTKWLLRRAAAGLLPPEILHRRKQGFAVPTGRWFQQGALTINANALPSYINRRLVREYLRRHRAGEVDERLVLWALLILQKVVRG